MKTLFGCKSLLVIGLLNCLLSVLTGCRNNDPRKEAEKIITEWIGKTILFPDSISCLEMNKNTTCPDYTGYPYKILLYADSTGCTNCKLHLREWEELIKEADTLWGGQVIFLFYFQPKYEQDLISSLRTNRFNYPVYLDVSNKIHQLNNFSSNEKYQCFLLDQDNQVIMIGNPMQNPAVWELFKQYITGEPQSQTKEILTTVAIDRTGLNFGEMNINQEKEIQIPLTNTGEQPLVIRRVLTSCGCTVVDWEKQPVSPGDITILSIKIKPDETGFFQKSIDVYCNISEKIIRLAVKGKVNE